MHATRIRRGDVIFPVIASANRDAQKFAEPDRLDVARKPNPHLAFGDGVHYCVGSHLAKMEAEIAFGCLLRRLPKLSLACPAHELRWRAAGDALPTPAPPMRLIRICSIVVELTDPNLSPRPIRAHPRARTKSHPRRQAVGRGDPAVVTSADRINVRQT